MRSRRRGQLLLGVGRDGLAVLRSGPARSAPRLLGVQALSTGGSGGSDIGPALSTLLDTLAAGEDLAGMAVQVVLDGHWTRHWIVEPPANARSLADCRSAAAVRFDMMYDEPLDGWHWTGDWQATAPTLCCALPKALLLALQQACATHRLVLQGIAPHFAVVWNRWHSLLADKAWLVLLHQSVVTLGLVDAGRLRALRLFGPLEAIADSNSWLRALVHREALRSQLALPDKLLLCDDLALDWQAGEYGGCACMRPPQPGAGMVRAPSGTGPDQATAGAVRLALQGLP
jgi:hypothetical protein